MKFIPYPLVLFSARWKHLFQIKGKKVMQKEKISRQRLVKDS